MTVLVTGAAGFIGFHLCKRLLESGERVIGIDNINNFYDTKLKYSRLEILKNQVKYQDDMFIFNKIDLENSDQLKKIFNIYKPDKVVNLAAQAGVRYSLENPIAYINSNLLGFCNILECCRFNKVKHLVYASSSSVYGGNTKLPFSEKNSVDHPVSLYAASKKSNELMGHAYSHLFDIPMTGLRFFTVYGPWGRPDMALFLFTKAIISGEPINIFNEGNMKRDFTYIDDIVESIERIIKKVPVKNHRFNRDLPDPSSSWAPHKIFNIGNSNPINLMHYIRELEESIGLKAVKNYLPMQPGDVKETAADTSALEEWIDFKPNTSTKKGIDNFVKWYRGYYDV